jgi:hypothetical protein
VCSPTPVARIEFLSVRCPTILFQGFAQLSCGSRRPATFKHPRRAADDLRLTLEVRKRRRDGRRPSTAEAHAPQWRRCLHGACRARYRNTGGNTAPCFRRSTNARLWRFVQRSSSSYKAQQVRLLLRRPVSRPAGAGTPGCPADPPDPCRDGARHPLPVDAGP